MLHTPGGGQRQLHLTVLPNAPSVFRTPAGSSGETVPTIVRYHNGRSGNGKVFGPDNPLAPEDYLVIYLTGMGKTTPEVDEGVPSPFDPPATALSQPYVTLNGVELPIAYAGLAPGQVGVYQINAYIPWWTPHGDNLPLVIEQSSSTTTVYVRIYD
jgi:uncharacterized protein (TIGR03437 family)